MAAIPGTMDEWVEIEPRRFARYVDGAMSVDDGILTLREGLGFAEYWAKRETEDAPARRRVDRLTIIRRLDALGLLGAAEKAIAAADPLTRWRWNVATDGVYADDEDTHALLKAIGADPDVVLAIDAKVTG